MISHRTIHIILVSIIFLFPMPGQAAHKWLDGCRKFVSPEKNEVIKISNPTFSIDFKCTSSGQIHSLVIKDANDKIVWDDKDRLFVGNLSSKPARLRCTPTNLNLPDGKYKWNIRIFGWGFNGSYNDGWWSSFTLINPKKWYRDADGDGYGDPHNKHPQLKAHAPSGYVNDNTDCDDTRADVHPGADEICDDDVDNDCLEGDRICHPELDKDGDGWTPNDGDCDDKNADIHPRAAEKCNDGVDQDCLGGDLKCAEVKCAEISDTPVVSGFAPPPNLIILWDNSGSMDWSFATNEDTEYAEGAYNGYYYVFGLDDQVYDDYEIPAGNARNTWKGRCHSYNRLYYNPNIDYAPWPDTNRYQNLKAFKDHNATSPRYARSHPIHNGNVTLDLDGLYVGSAHAGVDIYNAHYFIDRGYYTYLVQLHDGEIRYHRIRSDWDLLKAGSHTPERVMGSDIPDITSRTYEQERQNFANWFTFHRKRHYAAVVSITQMLRQMKGIRVGIQGVNTFEWWLPYHNINHKVLPIDVDGKNHVDILLDNLYKLKLSKSGTDLRRALKRVGDYFDDHNGDSVFYSDEEGGGCQHAFALIVTDGYWTANTEGFSNFGDKDGDGHPNTLADVAMSYYTGDISRRRDDHTITHLTKFKHQHMVTYAISINTKGIFNQADYPDCPDKCEAIYPAHPHCDNCPDWPNVTEDSPGKVKVDDLWHATVNTRGEFHAVNNPSALTNAFQHTAASIDSRIRSSSALTVNGNQLSTDTIFCQASYSTQGWTGDLTARGVNPTTGQLNDSIIWSASNVLESKLSHAPWIFSGTGRKIFTVNGNTAIAFSAAQADTIGISEDIINYIRGDKRLEGEGKTDFRKREKRLGDIVNSSPHFVNDTLFVGANDGMLHAFDAATGKEKFAYIPSFVIPHLEQLTHPHYTHRYYVDQSPASKSITPQTTYLVGGLGKGGKGYYCLDISPSKLNPTSETQAASQIFKWEFPRSTDNHMGYSYSQAHIVNTRAGWVVLFGNGYESTKGKAVLYVVKLSDGSLIRRINTKAGNPDTSCNGLSSPSPVDIDSDGIVDYVYAGDLLGNMWKFDLTHENPDRWHIPFISPSGWPRPLFRAKNKNGHYQPITSKPDVILHCDRSKSGYLIIFGTGRLLGKKDAVNASTQSLYGIWDWSEEWKNKGRTSKERNVSDKYLGDFQVRPNGKRRLGNIASRGYLPSKARYVTLEEQTEVHSNTPSLRVLSNRAIQWYQRDHDSNVSKYHVGWYMDLPQNRERILHGVRVRNKALIVVTNIPITNPCDLSSRSYLMELNPCTGGRTTAIYLDINKDGQLDAKDTVLIENPSSQGERIWVPPTGIAFEGSISLPTILKLENTNLERKYFSVSDGSTTTVDEAQEKLGPFYWKVTKD